MGHNSCLVGTTAPGSKAIQMASLAVAPGKDVAMSSGPV